jgi:hypothetical protein
MSKRQKKQGLSVSGRGSGDGLTFWRFAANLGAGFTAVWLLSYVIPATRTILLDRALSFFISLMVTLVLWRSAHRQIYPRRFWPLLAAAWFLGLLGNVAWGMYEVLSGESLPRISLIDLFYAIRYVLIGIAYWRSFLIPRGRQWLSLTTTMLLTAAILLAIVILSLPPSRLPASSIAGVFYPVLDAGLAYISWQAWRREPAGPQKNTLGLVALSILVYGVANTLNFLGLALSVDSLATLTGLFWPLSDVLVGAGVTHLVLTAPPSGHLSRATD